MSENLYKTIGTFTPDSLISGIGIPLNAKGITIASGQGELVRGTLLGKASDGTYKITKAAETGAIAAECILADGVDATSEAVVTTAYVSGCFNPAAITLSAGETISTYEHDLRTLGIYLKAVQQY
jgi:hypothetical protein